MRILYINYVDLDKVSSGSSVRPKKIFDAFNNLEYEVKMLSGLQNRIKERWKNAWQFFKEIRKEDYDLCYVESPSGPIFNFCDHLLLLYISKVKKIPIGFFYRDAFWKFASWYKLGKVKSTIIHLMHKFDWAILNSTCTKMYFPSDTMAKLFDFKNKEALPPGAASTSNSLASFNNHMNCIYVGGVSERYGTEILLKAFDIINSTYDKEITLTLICREEIDIIKKYRKYKWLKFYTGISGEEQLKSFYENADLAIIPFKRDLYMDFAIPIKMFEYITNKKPIVATNCIELSKFIEEYRIGIVTEDNAESLAKGIIEFFNMNLDEKNKFYSSLNKAVDENTWEKRVQQIIKLKTEDY